MALSEDEKAELVAYLDGELDESATQAIEAKIATNPDARTELDALKQAWGMLDYLPKASPSPNFTNRTMERLSLEKVGSAAKTQPMPRPWPAWVSASAWLASVALALIGGYLTMYFWPRPAVPDPVPDLDLPIVQHLRLLEKWRYYENADDLGFVEKLPDLFGEDPS